MKLQYIKTINLTKNYVYLTDKLMGVKILGKAESYLQIDDSITYKAAYIGKSKPGISDILNNCSYFATNKIVRIGNTPINAFTDESYHISIYITDLFVVTRKSNNIYDKHRAFFSSIIDAKDKIKIENKYNKLIRLLEDLQF